MNFPSENSTTGMPLRKQLNIYLNLLYVLNNALYTKEIRMIRIKIFILMLVFSTKLLSYEPTLRTDQELAASPWTDHVRHFEKLFKSIKIHSFLEFGLGEGTKYFLDHCDEVTSIDLIPDNNRKVKNVNTAWHQQCINLYKDYPNWDSQLYYCSDLLSQADEISNSRCDPEQFIPDYLLEIKAICDQFITKTYDVIFVDPGVVVRADIVNELFGRTDIIVAHDYWEPKPNTYEGPYGWNKINTPSNYEKIFFPSGSGTVFWINKDRVELINALIDSYK